MFDSRCWPQVPVDKGTPTSDFIKGIKNGCPCIVEIRGTQGCALVGDPAQAAGECRDVAKAQPYHLVCMK